MEAMEGMGVKEGIKKTRTAYIADDGNIFATEFQRLQSPVKSMDDLFMRTAGTEYRWPACVEKSCHAVTSLTILSGEISSPFICP
jgi:hypothetical protein